MDVGQAAEMYAAGMTLRQVAAALGVRHHWSVGFQLRRAGLARRAPIRARRVLVPCGWCEQPIAITPYQARNGGGSNLHPRPAKFHYHAGHCRAAMIRYAGGLRYLAFWFDAPTAPSKPRGT